MLNGELDYEPLNILIKNNFNDKCTDCGYTTPTNIPHDQVEDSVYLYYNKNRQ